MRSQCLLDKKKIIKSFSRRAVTYDEVSSLQKALAGELCDIVCSLNIRPKNILDVGTGTGELAFLLADIFPNSRIIGADIAPGMIEKAKEKNKVNNVIFDIADAEDLPFDDNLFDLIVSSSTYQWVEDLDKAFKECSRVSREKAYFIFSTFGGGTLKELKEFYLNLVDKNAQYFHKYKTEKEIKNILKESGFNVISSSSEPMKRKYKSLRDLFATLKKTGAMNASKTFPSGLKGKKKMQKLVRLYDEEFKYEDGVYATYESLQFTCSCI